jgi:DNA/RNA endonuclease G (NUC1)
MIRKHLIEGLALAILTLVLAACHDNGGGTEVKITNKVTLQNDSVPYTNTGQFLSIETSVEWTAEVTCEKTEESEEPWCTLLTASGKGTVSDVLTLEKNGLPVSRRAVVKVSFSDGETISVTLIQGPAPKVVPDPVNPLDSLVSDPYRAWMELPSFQAEKGVALVEHFCTLNGGEVRNWSCKYNATYRVSEWVAYPLYSAFMGSASRTDNWNYDPKVPKSLQPVLFRGGLNDGTNYYDRGHQIPSADRLSSYDVNSSTFYFTNMTPQVGKLNQGVWANLEMAVRSWAAQCDTLYVVTGCVLQTSSDKTVNYALDNEGGNMAIPKAYYKVLLKYRIASGSYSAIGFWYENKDGYSSNPSKEQTYTVREIEDRTGEDFFPNLPDDIENKVETEYLPDSWL